MKIFSLTTIFALIFLNIAFAQIADTEDKIHTTVDEAATFLGCETKKNTNKRIRCAHRKMEKFISDQLKTPIAVTLNHNKEAAIVSFIVEKDGQISNAEIKTNPGNGLGEELLRVVNKMPKWNPGTINNQPVRTRRQIRSSYPEIIYKPPVIIKNLSTLEESNSTLRL